jgi:hypothetical protein
MHRSYLTIVCQRIIDSGVDSRPRSEIEWAAKIGISLGAMYRACEADGCDKVEGRDIEKMLTCARCKVVRLHDTLYSLACSYCTTQTFYCSASCQKVHWRTPKPLCGSLDQTEQPLSSQVALSDFVCKYSPGLMKYRMMEGSIEGSNFDQFTNDLG